MVLEWLFVVVKNKTKIIRKKPQIIGLAIIASEFFLTPVFLMCNIYGLLKSVGNAYENCEIK